MEARTAPYDVISLMCRQGQTRSIGSMRGVGCEGMGADAGRLQKDCNARTTRREAGRPRGKARRGAREAEQRTQTHLRPKLYGAIALMRVMPWVRRGVRVSVRVRRRAVDPRPRNRSLSRALRVGRLTSSSPSVSLPSVLSSSCSSSSSASWMSEKGESGLRREKRRQEYGTASTAAEGPDSEEQGSWTARA